MPDSPSAPEPTFLRRWSQRKLAAARETEAAPQVAAPAATVPAALPAAPVSMPAAQAESAPPMETLPLPDVASLTFDSDFTAFLAPRVEEGTRRAALRKLFSDPRFNAMDGLDVYIDDYSKFEPVTPELLAQMKHVRYLFDPPKTRVNEHGHVEDVVEEIEPGGAEPDDPPEASAEPASVLPVDSPASLADLDQAQADAGTVGAGNASEVVPSATSSVASADASVAVPPEPSPAR